MAETLRTPDTLTVPHETFNLMYLNTWGGRVEGMLDFVAQHAPNTDAFMFSEVFNDGDTSIHRMRKVNPNLYQDLVGILDRFKPSYTPHQPRDEGLALFVADSVNIRNFRSPFVFGHYNAMENQDPRTLGRSLQVAELERNGRAFTLAHFHGLWNGKGKTDTADRIRQSENVALYLSLAPNPQVLMGDFNLRPETASLHILEEGRVNLIHTHGITSTRTKLYGEEKLATEPFADYALVTPDVEVVDFQVMPDVVSDHSPLRLTVRV